MLRKVTGILIAIFALVAGTISAAPANATGSYSAPSAFDANINVAGIFPANDQYSTMVWESSDNSVGYLKAARLNLDGTVDHITVLDSGPNASYSLGKLPDAGLPSAGVKALAWIKRLHVSGSSFQTSGIVSSVYASFSDDGSDWSPAVQVFEDITYLHNDPNCQNAYFCGYMPLNVAVDKRGAVAISVGIASDAPATVRVKTSFDGATWSSSTVLPSTGNQTYVSSLIGLDEGGFLIALASSDGSTNVIYTSRTSSQLSGTWTRPVEVARGSFDFYSARLAKISPSNYSLLFFSNSNTDTILARKSYNAGTRVWSENEILLSIPNTFLSSSSVGIASNGNRSAIVLAAGIFGQGAAKLEQINFIGNVAQPAAQLDELATQSIDLFGLRVNNDNTVSFGYSGQFQAAKMVNVSTGNVATTSTIPIDMPAGFGFGAVSPNGNLFLQLNSPQITTAKTIAYTGAEKPQASGNLTVKGIAKKGAKLSASAVSFAGKSGFGVTTYQWYACSAAVPTGTLAVPITCIPITKATAAQFKVAAKQKGKFITVAITNTNAVGTTTLVAPVGKKSK
jgi:hypothetical protein